MARKRSRNAGVVASSVAKSAVSARRRASIAFATVWLYAFLILSLFVVYVTQQVVKAGSSAIPTRKSKKKVKIESKKRMNKIFQTVFGKLLIDWNPFWERIVEYDMPKEELPQPAIVMCNHISYADGAFWLGALDFCPVPVVKHDLFVSPIVGGIAKNSGFLPVFFKKKKDGRWGTDKEQLDLMMKKAEEKLNQNVSISLAPEGTIPADGKLAPFKPGFFRLAVKTGTPIIPASLWGNQVAIPMGPKDKRGYSSPVGYASPARSVIHMSVPIPSIDFDELQSNDKLNALVDQTINDSSNDLTAEDFETQDPKEVGQKLFAARENSPVVDELIDALVETLIAKTRGEIIARLEEIRPRYADYEEAEREKDIAREELITRSISFT